LTILFLYAYPVSWKKTKTIVRLNSKITSSLQNTIFTITMTINNVLKVRIYNNNYSLYRMLFCQSVLLIHPIAAYDAAFVRFFRIRQEKSREVPPGGGLTMTSYPIGNKTSLSRKPCIADKKLLWITIMKSWSLSNFYEKKTATINLKNVSLYKCC